MDLNGLEPFASCLQNRRSPTDELKAHQADYQHARITHSASRATENTMATDPYAPALAIARKQLSMALKDIRRWQSSHSIMMSRNRLARQERFGLRTHIARWCS